MNEPLLAALGRRVKALRGALALTLRELAGRSGLSERFLVQIEAGTGNVSVLKLAALAGALQTTPAALLAEPIARARRRLPAITLLGLRGAGKSSVGRRLARRLRVPFIELDRRIEEAAGLSLSEVFAIHGETYYRRLERQALDRVLGEGPLVLAAGGGIVASPSTYSRLRRGTLCIWLRANPEDHWNRVVQQGDRRPMADHPQAMTELRRLLQSREPLYAKAAHTVNTSGRDPEAIVDAVAKWVAKRRTR
jgi:XRE family aerobic/anaerobic benzoate catabolism transcriptional regulator